MNRLFLLRTLLLASLAATAGFADSGSAGSTLDRYLDNGKNSCNAPGRAESRSLAIEIEASLPKLKKQGSMEGLKVVSASGQVAYRFLRFTGDKLIKTDVIARFLTAESQPPERLGNIATTLENYKIHYQKEMDYDGTRAYVYQLKPRKKRAGLFKGELWLDAGSGMPVRESGELVKSPSIFIQRIQFVRDYPDHNREQGTCSTPQKTSITVHTRLVGDARMVVRQHPVPDSWQPPTVVEPTAQPTSGDGQ